MAQGDAVYTHLVIRAMARGRGRCRAQGDTLGEAEETPSSLAQLTLEDEGLLAQLQRADQVEAEVAAAEADYLQLSVRRSTP
jgi:hypothetical protein